MTRKIYETFEVSIVMIEDEVVRTSGIFIPNEAPDVYEPDPFIEG